MGAGLQAKGKAAIGAMMKSQKASLLQIKAQPKAQPNPSEVEKLQAGVQAEAQKAIAGLQANAKKGMAIPQAEAKKAQAQMAGLQAKGKAALGNMMKSQKASLLEIKAQPNPSEVEKLQAGVQAEAQKAI